MKSNKVLRKLFFATDISEELIERLGLIKFDYFNTELSEELVHLFGDQYERTKLLLKERTVKEIKVGIDSLKWMLESMEFDCQDMDLAHLNDAMKSSFSSRVVSLRYIRNEFDIDNIENFQDAKWYEFFALLALLHIIEIFYVNQAKVVDVHAIKKEIDMDIAQFIYDMKPGIYSGYALDAMDSIGHAEGLYDAYMLIETHKQERIKRASKGGATKNRPTNLLKYDVIESYKEKKLKNPKLTALAGAKKIYKEMKDRIDTVLQTEDPIKRLEIWIGKYKKTLQ